MPVLNRVRLTGFRSINRMDLELRPLNILIGANGSGKSSLVAFFEMLNEMMGERLREFIARTGRATSNLHLGPAATPMMTACLQFPTDKGLDYYVQRLSYAAGDSLAFAEETVTRQTSEPHANSTTSLGVGHVETKLNDTTSGWNPTVGLVRSFLKACRVYHFHDTSATSRIRQYCYVGDNRSLLHDAGNLAPFLLRLRDENGGWAYQRILSTIQLMAPFVDDFELQPGGPHKTDVILNRRQKGSDQVFGAHQLSDGTLRAICLTALLLQPDEELPGLIVVDEPELGLHPYALNLVASMFEAASRHTQVLICTQSSTFLNNFDPADVIVVDRKGNESQFLRPDTAKLEQWLEDYTLGEVWEKNVIGGGPH